MMKLSTIVVDCYLQVANSTSYIQLDCYFKIYKQCNLIYTHMWLVNEHKVCMVRHATATVGQSHTFMQLYIHHLIVQNAKICMSQACDKVMLAMDCVCVYTHWGSYMHNYIKLLLTYSQLICYIPYAVASQLYHYDILT